MNDEKKSAPVLASQGAQGVSLVTPTVSQQVGQSQAQNAHKSGNSKKERHPLGIDSKVYSAALKFYGEQVVAGAAQDAAGLIARIKAIDPKQLQVLAICHNKDEVTNGIWAVAAVKPHWHVIVRCTDRKNRKKVSTILNTLGIRYRPGLDDELWTDHGVETVGNFPGYAMYLTHETEEAIRDAKERYDVSEIISNLTPEEVEQVRAGYIRVSANRKVTAMELVSLDREAYDLGYELKDFDEWYGEHGFNVRSNPKMKTIKESYVRGVDARIKAQVELTRLCVYIKGEPNSGKSYAAVKSFPDGSVLRVNGGGTGKFDKLTASTDVIVIDDDVCPNLLNMSDNYICRAYRRQSNNPPWAGHYLIVTSNLDFNVWLEKCGIGYEHFAAIYSRFFICELEPGEDGHNRLHLLNYSTRGTTDSIIKRFDMYDAFASRYNALLSAYKPVGESDAVINRYLDSPSSGFAEYESELEKGVEDEYAHWLAQDVEAIVDARAEALEKAQREEAERKALEEALKRAKQRPQKDAGTIPIIRNYG